MIGAKYYSYDVLMHFDGSIIERMAFQCDSWKLMRIDSIHFEQVSALLLMVAYYTEPAWSQIKLRLLGNDCRLDQVRLWWLGSSTHRRRHWICMRSRSYALTVQAKIGASFWTISNIRRRMGIAGCELRCWTFRRVLRMNWIFCQSIVRLSELLLLAREVCIWICSSIESGMLLRQGRR